MGGIATAWDAYLRHQKEKERYKKALWHLGACTQTMNEEYYQVTNRINEWEEMLT